MKLNVEGDGGLSLLLQDGRERDVVMGVIGNLAYCSALSRKDRKLAARYPVLIAERFPLSIREGELLEPAVLLRGQAAYLAVQGLNWYVERQQHEDAEESVLTESLQQSAVQMYLQLHEWQDEGAHADALAPRHHA